MAKVKLEDGRVLNFEGNPTQQDIEEAVSSLGTTQQQSGPTQQPGQVEGKSLTDIGSQISGIGPRPGALERFQGKVTRNLPEAAQIIGSVGGGIIGSRVGAPVRGQAIGGTGMRALGEVVQKGLRGQFGDVTTAEKKQAGREILENTAVAAGSEFAFGGLGKLFSGLGKGALEGLLGPRVAQRGTERGFKSLLDPKFFQGRLPKEVAEKTGRFFSKLDTVTGKGVEKAVRAKSAKGITVKVSSLKKAANEALEKQGAPGVTIDDIFPEGTSKAQISKVKFAKKLVDRIKQDEISLLSAWKTRRQIDKIRFGSTFSDDVARYLDDLRGAFNKPLTRLPSIKQAFGRYSSVKNLEKDLGKKFSSTLIDGDTFSPKTEQFANNLLGTSKDETIRGLRKLDSLLIANDQVIEGLLDVAATESLEKPLQNIGTLQRMVTEAAGGRKAIAGAAARLQTPQAGVIKRLLQSVPPAATTGIITATEEELQGEQ